MGIIDGVCWDQPRIGLQVQKSCPDVAQPAAFGSAIPPMSRSCPDTGSYSIAAPARGAGWPLFRSGLGVVKANAVGNTVAAACFSTGLGTVPHPHAPRTHTTAPTTPPPLKVIASRHR